MPDICSKRQRILISMVLMLALSACDPFGSPPDIMETYLERLARVLAVETNAVEKPAPAIWPRVRERRVVTAEIEINMLQFLDLYGCDLQVVVGERNAILGRVMQPLNRLRYSLRFIEEAQICINNIDDAALKQTLQQVTQQKRQQLPAEIWQAGWASREMAGLFSHTAKPLAVDKPLAVSQQLAEDFAYLTQTSDALLSETSTSALSRWGTIHQRWQYQDDLGALIKSAQQLTQMLDTGSAMLKQRTDQTPLCYQGKPNPRATQLQGVFFKVYIGHVQPYIAAVSQHRDALLPMVRQFAVQQQTIAPVAVNDYWQRYVFDDPESIWMAFDTALNTHTRQWQDLLAQCGLKPKAGGTQQ